MAPVYVVLLILVLWVAPAGAQDPGGEPADPAPGTAGGAPAAGTPAPDPAPAEPTPEAVAEEALDDELGEWDLEARREQSLQLPWWVEREAWEVGWRDGFMIRRNDGYHELRVGFRLLLDQGFWYEGSGLREGDPDQGWNRDFETRLSRFSFQGLFFGRFIYRVVYDLSDTEFKDAQIGVRDVGPARTILFGQIKEPFGIEQATSIRNVTFLERSLANALSPRRELGFRANGVLADARIRWDIGAFFLDDATQEEDASLTGLDEQGEIAMRLSGLPIWRDYGRTMLLVGASYSRLLGESTALSLAADPESQLVDPILDTGPLPGVDSLTRVGLEAAFVNGPLSIQGELLLNDFDSETGDGTFWGGYLEASWFLTGEHRVYGRASGVFGRVVPKRPFSWGERTWGAVQVAARVSYLDLDDGAIRGGQQLNTTLGVNWYLAKSVRVSANWVHGEVHGDGHLDVLQVRFQLDY